MTFEEAEALFEVDYLAPEAEAVGPVHPYEELCAMTADQVLALINYSLACNDSPELREWVAGLERLHRALLTFDILLRIKARWGHLLDAETRQ